MHTHPGPALSLSFDDGWRSAYDNALPILQEFGLPGTFYVISGCFDDRQFPRYMNEKQALELQAHGHEIGCHTASHKHLADESPSIVREEILLSAAFMRESGFVLDTFAYPFGEYNEDVVSVVRQGAFRGARSVIEGYNDAAADPYLLKCQAVTVATAPAEVANWIAEAMRTGTWLILMFHQIDHEGRAWSSTPETLRAILSEIRAHQIPVMTVREGLSRMGV